MPRFDISIDAVYGEPNLTGNLTGKAICNISLLGDLPGMDNDRICYGEILLPAGSTKIKDGSRPVYAYLDYTPLYKELYLRIRTDNGNTGPEYFYNPANNKQWFPVVAGDDGEQAPVFLSKYREINPNGYFALRVRGGYLFLYSGEETDFTIKAALKQNEIFLLKAFAGNLYQYPATGVGLIDFLHGNFENTGLAARLQQEFEKDRMIINNAYMDSRTGELYLDVTEKDG